MGEDPSANRSADWLRLSLRIFSFELFAKLTANTFYAPITPSTICHFAVHLEVVEEGSVGEADSLLAEVGRLL